MLSRQQFNVIKLYFACRFSVFDQVLCLIKSLNISCVRFTRAEKCSIHSLFSIVTGVGFEFRYFIGQSHN